MRLKTLLRTSQTYVPGLLDAKFWAQRLYRRSLRIPFEADFRALRHFPDTEGALYLDVGANRGQSIDAIRMNKKHCLIQSFEPNPIIFSKLTKIFSGVKQLHLNNFGLGQENQDLDLFVPYYRNFMFDGLASFIEEEASDWLRSRLINFREELLSVRKVRCRIRRLDDLSLHPYFIKMDIQGFELAALRGSLNTIRRAKPILMVEAPSAQVQEFLSNLGYSMYIYANNQFIPGGVPRPNAFFLTQGTLQGFRLPSGSGA